MIIEIAYGYTQYTRFKFEKKRLLLFREKTTIASTIKANRGDMIYLWHRLYF